MISFPLIWQVPLFIISLTTALYLIMRHRLDIDRRMVCQSIQQACNLVYWDLSICGIHYYLSCHIISHQHWLNKLSRIILSAVIIKHLFPKQHLLPQPQLILIRRITPLLYCLKSPNKHHLYPAKIERTHSSSALYASSPFNILEQLTNQQLSPERYADDILLVGDDVLLIWFKGTLLQMRYR